MVEVWSDDSDDYAGIHRVRWDFGDELNEWSRLMGQESGGAVSCSGLMRGRRGGGVASDSWRKAASPLSTHPLLVSLVQNDEARPPEPIISSQSCKCYALFLSTLFPFPPWMVLTINAMAVTISSCGRSSLTQILFLWHRFRKSLVLESSH